MNNADLQKDIELAIWSRKQGEDEKHSEGFWDLSIEIMESENPQELIYNYLTAFETIVKRYREDK